MRPPCLAALALLSLITIPAAAQQQPGSKSEPGVNQRMQTEADKGIKTRNSGESGYVADQDKPGAASRAPGEPANAGTTTGNANNAGSNLNSSQADYNASLKDGSAPNSASKK